MTTQEKLKDALRLLTEVESDILPSESGLRAKHVIIQCLCNLLETQKRISAYEFSLRSESTPAEVV